jgi:hypothetical protein
MGALRSQHSLQDSGALSHYGANNTRFPPRRTVTPTIAGSSQEGMAMALLLLVLVAASSHCFDAEPKLGPDSMQAPLVPTPGLASSSFQDK